MSSHRRFPIRLKVYDSLNASLNACLTVSQSESVSDGFTIAVLKGRYAVRTRVNPVGYHSGGPVG